MPRNLPVGSVLAWTWQPLHHDYNTGKSDWTRPLITTTVTKLANDPIESEAIVVLAVEPGKARVLTLRATEQLIPMGVPDDQTKI